MKFTKLVKADLQSDKLEELRQHLFQSINLLSDFKDELDITDEEINLIDDIKIRVRRYLDSINS